MQLMAVSRHRQIAASNFMRSGGVAQLGKNGFAAYSANVSATIACDNEKEISVKIFYNYRVR